MSHGANDFQDLRHLSVLVSSFNKLDFLRTSEIFLTELAELGAEVIIVEDGSTDGSVETLQSWEPVKIGKITLLDQPNRGSAFSRNKAIQNASRDYLLFVDIDDRINVKILRHLFPSILVSTPDIALTGYKQIPVNRFGPYPLEDFSSSVIQIAGRREDLFKAMGWWRYIYKRELLIKNNLSFVPTFEQLGGKIFVLDDLFWLLHLFSLDLKVYRANNEDVVYEYHLPEVQPTSRINWYLDQVELIPDAMKVFLSDLKNHMCAHDNKWLLDQSKISLWQHANFLSFSRFLRSSHKFLKASFYIDRLAAKKSFFETFRLFIVSFLRISRRSTMGHFTR